MSACWYCDRGIKPCRRDEYPDGPPDAATSPLVAASPVPPVVPDSEPLAEIPASMPQDGLHWYRRWLVAQQQLDAKFQREVSSGSGVVPDKPALDLNDVEWPTQERLVKASREWNCGPTGPGLAAVVVSMCQRAVYAATRRPNASVPAVTDYEAATKVIARAAWFAHGIDDEPQDGEPDWVVAQQVARSVIAELRSAGFLIVHPMQRGPEDPTFVMPDITAVHHTKET